MKNNVLILCSCNGHVLERAQYAELGHLKCKSRNAKLNLTPACLTQLQSTWTKSNYRFASVSPSGDQNTQKHASQSKRTEPTIDQPSVFNCLAFFGALWDLVLWPISVRYRADFESISISGVFGTFSGSFRPHFGTSSISRDIDRQVKPAS